jgi:Na+-transporting NADH:ubiquinone oxidoreductase subunit C
MYLYVVKLTVIIAAILAGLANVLDPMIKANREGNKKASILSAVIPKDQMASIANPAAVFDDRITVKAYYPKEKKMLTSLEEFNKRSTLEKKYKTLVDLDLAAEDKVPVEDRIYPFYEYKADNGSNLYILAIRGSGLWDKIWGYVAIDKEGTIQGVSFDHKGETPGLGAEIKDSDRFKEQFKGKKIFDVQKQLVSVTVQKRSIKKPDHQVMGISGATITSDGVTEMLQRGIKVYENHLAELRK